MEQRIDAFSERIAIKGIEDPINFTFRTIDGQTGGYQVKTTKPLCDFNMLHSTASETIKFNFSDESEVPLWIKKDKGARAKLSRAIVFAFRG